MTCDAAGKPADFPMNTRAAYPFSAVRSGLIASKTCLVVKTNGAPRSGLVLGPFLANGPYHRGKVTRVSRSSFRKDSGKVLSGDPQALPLTAACEFRF